MNYKAIAEILKIKDQETISMTYSFDDDNIINLNLNKLISIENMQHFVNSSLATARTSDGKHIDLITLEYAVRFHAIVLFTDFFNHINDTKEDISVAYSSLVYGEDSLFEAIISTFFNNDCSSTVNLIQDLSEKTFDEAIKINEKANRKFDELIEVALDFILKSKDNMERIDQDVLSNVINKINNIPEQNILDTLVDINK